MPVNPTSDRRPIGAAVWPFASRSSVREFAQLGALRDDARTGRPRRRDRPRSDTSRAPTRPRSPQPPRRTRAAAHATLGSPSERETPATRRGCSPALNTSSARNACASPSLSGSSNRRVRPSNGIDARHGARGRGAHRARANRHPRLRCPGSHSSPIGLSGIAEELSLCPPRRALARLAQAVEQVASPPRASRRQADGVILGLAQPPLGAGARRAHSSHTILRRPPARNTSGCSPRSSRRPHTSQATSGWEVTIMRVAIGFVGE